MEAEYEANPRAYRSGAKVFHANAAIYGAKSVKTALRVAHHSKCAYCEEFLQKKTTYGHVEHYRPTAYSQQEASGEPIRPGYYWLAYDWDNLLWSCHYCNSTRKGNQFPLVDPTSRARRHNRVIENERPMLIKPDVEEPACHIDWRKEVPFPRTPRGEATIRALGLDLPAHEMRLAHYRILERTLKILVDCNESLDPKARAHAGEARTLLLRWSKPEQPFSAMVAAFLRDNPLPNEPAKPFA